MVAYTKNRRCERSLFKESVLASSEPSVPGEQKNGKATLEDLNYHAQPLWDVQGGQRKAAAEKIVGRLKFLEEPTRGRRER